MKNLSFAASIKRQISGLLIFAMFVSCFNFAVLAEEDTAEENVIGNNGFENAFASEISDWKFTTAGNWEYQNTTLETEEKYDGNQAALIGSGSAKGYIGQRVTLNLETTYVLEAYVKGGSANLRICRGDKTYPNSTDNVITQMTTDSYSDWQKVSLEYTTWARWGSYTSYDFVIIIQGSSDTDQIYIDNISLTEKLPEVDYENEKLINFGSSYSYTINDSAALPDYGELEEGVTSTDGALNIENSWFGNQITINRSNSSGALIKTQLLTVPARPDAPEESIFTVTQPDTSGGTGTIAGITSAMEYSTDNGTTWTAGSGEEISGISEGSEYLVRYKASASSFRSESCSIKIEEVSEPAEKATPQPNKETYSQGVLEIGDSVSFDFGSSTADGYIGVDAARDYFDGSDDTNGLTYGFLGLGKEGYGKTSSKDDSFEMVKDEQITLYNGGTSGSLNASQDNVYAYQSIFPEDSDTDYNMGGGVVPVRFALKSARHSYYKVKATVGCADASEPATVSIFNEKRHPVVTNKELAAGETYTVEFTANVMDVYYKNDKAVYSDEMLNIIVAGENAGLAILEITRLDPSASPKTIWVCSDSTGCDQLSYMPFYPMQNYCGVGQYLSKYLTDMTVSNQGEGGLASSDNMHFYQATSQWKSGDYLYVEYGHNENSVDEYKSNLEKYYEAAHEDGVKMIVVGPIDRTQTRLYDSNTHTWSSSLSAYSMAGKEFVEEKITDGADDIVFIDLNASWVEFLNTVTEDVANTRLNLGLDSELTYSASATHYYYTYNKMGANDQTHINDYGADNAANIFFEQVKAAVDDENATASQKTQAAVLQGIYDDIKTDASPSAVSSEVIQEGYAPNSLYPDKYSSRVEYPYSASIEEITLNENGTLNTAKVRVLQDLAQYAAVYVTAYDEDGNSLGTIVSLEHIDNTSDKQGAVKELAFNSDIIPHHFKATVYYCDENNSRLSEYKSAVSAKYESRKVLKALLEDGFSDLEDGDSAYSNGWSGYGSMSTRTMIKQTDTDGESYANMVSSDGNSSYTWKNLSETVTEGTLEVSFKLRYNSGSVNILTGNGRANNNYGTTNSAIALSGNSVSFNSVSMGQVNAGEWIDYKYLIDIDNQTATGYVGAYGSSTAAVTLNTSDINQLMIDATSKTAFDVDIKDIKVCLVETYDFTVKDKVQTSDPQAMDSIYRRSLLFGGSDATDEDEGVFGKTGTVYLLGNTSANISNWGSETEKGVKSGSNVYATVNVAMETASTASLRFGRSGYYMEINFAAGDADTDEASEITATGNKNATPTALVTLKPETWYRLDFSGDSESYIGKITVIDIVNNKTVTELDISNVWSATQVTGSSNYIYWNKDGSVGNVYIANSWLYSKTCGKITADSDNVTLSGAPTCIGETAEVTVTANDGYTLKSISYNDETVDADENSAAVSVRGTESAQTIKVTLESQSIQETMPQIAINFADETLTGFDADGSYTINENTVTASGGVLDIAGEWYGTELSIVKKGNGTSTSDSEAQSLEIPARPSEPASIFAVNASDENADDGSITGVTADMEYKLSGGTEWKDVTGTEITGLAIGTYDVRIKATETSFASDVVTVTVSTDGKYIIRFVNYDGAELLNISVSEGEMPVYTAETPARTQDDKYTYTFSGWSPEIAAAAAEAVYTAQYEQTPRTYSITLITNGGTVNSEDVTRYTYGTAVSLPTDVTRENYSFDGWYDSEDFSGTSVMEISAYDTGDKIYYAKWTESSLSEYLEVRTAFKDILTVEKVSDDMGTALVISPIDEEVLPELMLYSAIYSADRTLKSVVFEKYAVDETGKIQISLSKPDITDDESCKLMIWTANQEPLIEAINGTEFFDN